MSDESETVVTAAAVVDLIDRLTRTIDTLHGLQKRIGEISFGLSRLSKNLHRLKHVLSQHSQQIREVQETLSALPLCICCCRLLLTRIEMRLERFSSSGSRTGIFRWIGWLRIEFWAWRLGRKAARQIEAFLHVFRADDGDTEVRERTPLNGRKLPGAISRIQNDTAAMFENSVGSFLTELLSRRAPSSDSKEAFVRNLCDRHFHMPDLGRSLHDYINIKDPGQRSQFIDLAMVHDFRRRRHQECRIPIHGPQPDEERVVAALDELREPGGEGGSRRRPGFFKDVKLSVGEIQVHSYQFPRSGMRHKWIHYFDESDAVLVAIDMASYNLTLMEDQNVTRFAESKVLFDSIVNSRWYKGIPIILVLNNADVFARKLQSDPLEQWFPDYSGGADFGRAAGFMLDKLAKENKAGTLIYPIFALSDNASFTVPFCSAVQEAMLHKELKKGSDRRTITPAIISAMLGL